MLFWDRHNDMRGDDRGDNELFLYGSLEERVPEKHPLRPIRVMVDAALESMSGRFDEMYAKAGRPSIAPERLLRALLLQALYSIRSERMLVEQLEYNLLFRWFVGLNMSEPAWNHAVFSKNRERLLAGDVAHELFACVVEQARALKLLSDEHFTVDGTLIEAWASHKSFKPKDGDD
ncbi:MAG: IS5 family transposase, partial [Bryobacteraceae bacterium]|nr:IS5 family transposase [Bryobacteraceae bacterium]